MAVVVITPGYEESRFESANYIQVKDGVLFLLDRLDGGKFVAAFAAEQWISADADPAASE